MNAAPIVGQGLNTVATVSGIIGTVVAVLVGTFTYRLTFKGAKGSDWDRLAGTLSTWSQGTIAEMQTRLERAEADCQGRITEAEARLKAEIRAATARGDWWRGRAEREGPEHHDDTPPPEPRRN
jgi:hypothetical protein